MRVAQGIAVGGTIHPPVWGGGMATSAYRTVIIDRVQPYSGDWGRRFWNELGGGRGLFTGGVGVQEAAHVNHAIPALRRVRLRAERSELGTSFAVAGYGLEGQDQDMDQYVDTDAILRDVVPAWNYSLHAFQVLVTNPGAVAANLKCEVKDTNDAVVFASVQSIAAGFNGAVTYTVPTMFRAKRLNLVLDPPDGMAVSEILIARVQAILADDATVRDRRMVALATSYGQMRRGFNPSNNLVRDQISFEGGVFDSIPATGFMVLTTAMAVDAGLVAPAAGTALAERCVAGLLSVERHASGILPHWTAGTNRHPDSEWSTVDTALALLSAVVGAEMLGLTEARRSVESLLDAVDGASLRDANGFVHHGFDAATGDPIPYAWDQFGGEQVVAELLAGWAQPEGFPANPPNGFRYPPVFKGRGFIQEIAGCILPIFGRHPGYDRRGVSWLRERQRLQALQQAVHPGAPYGISSGEAILYDNYEQAVYFSPDLLPLADTVSGTGPWVFPHYMALVADCDPLNAQHLTTMMTDGSWSLWSGPAECFCPSYIHRTQITLNAFFHVCGWYYATRRALDPSLSVHTDKVHLAAMRIPKLRRAMQMYFPFLGKT